MTINTQFAKHIEKNELNLAVSFKLKDRANQREKFYAALKKKAEKRRDSVMETIDRKKEE